MVERILKIGPDEDKKGEKVKSWDSLLRERKDCINSIFPGVLFPGVLPLIKRLRYYFVESGKWSRKELISGDVAEKFIEEVILPIFKDERNKEWVKKEFRERLYQKVRHNIFKKFLFLFFKPNYEEDAYSVAFISTLLSPCVDINEVLELIKLPKDEFFEKVKKLLDQDNNKEALRKNEDEIVKVLTDGCSLDEDFDIFESKFKKELGRRITTDYKARMTSIFLNEVFLIHELRHYFQLRYYSQVKSGLISYDDWSRKKLIRDVDVEEFIEREVLPIFKDEENKKSIRAGSYETLRAVITQLSKTEKDVEEFIEREVLLIRAGLLYETLRAVITQLSKTEEDVEEFIEREVLPIFKDEENKKSIRAGSYETLRAEEDAQSVAFISTLLLTSANININEVLELIKLPKDEFFNKAKELLDQNKEALKENENEIGFLLNNIHKVMFRSFGDYYEFCESEYRYYKFYLESHLRD